MSAAAPRIAQGFCAYELKPLASNAIEVHAAEGLDLIHRNDTNLIVWPRGEAPDVTPFLSSLPDARDRAFDDDPLTIRVDQLADDMDRAMRRLVKRTNADRRPLQLDLMGMGILFALATGTSAIRLRVERLSHDGCRYFHTDKVGIRLLSTYLGPGTQWLPNEAVDRTKLGTPERDLTCRDEAAIQTIPTGAIALLKGEAYERNAGRGIVHRSPPARGTGEERVVVTMDEWPNT